MKSSFLPIDKGAWARAFPTMPISWVSHIKYLGIVVSTKVADISAFILQPLVPPFKRHLEAWRHLYLLLLGRINLLTYSTSYATL